MDAFLTGKQKPFADKIFADDSLDRIFPRHMILIGERGERCFDFIFELQLISPYVKTEKGEEA